VLKTRQILNVGFLEVLKNRQVLRVGGFFHCVLERRGRRGEFSRFGLFCRRFSTGGVLGGPFLCKILKGSFLEWLVLLKILRVGGISHSVICMGLFNHDDTTARRRKLATKNTKNTKEGEKRDLKLKIGDFRKRLGRATNAHE
jgi:hypothetical protein